MTMNIFELLQEVKVEKDVEEKYRVILREYYPTCTISSPYRTDGFLVVPELELSMLMEVKHDSDFSKRLNVVNLLIQLIYYVKQFELHGDELPKVLFGGDKNECFCLHSNDISSYLNEDLDWTISPSDAPFHESNINLVNRLHNDKNITPYTHSINDNKFDFGQVALNINQINKGVVQKVRITDLNISRYFDYFCEKIVKFNKKKLTPDDEVSIFLGCIIDPENNYPNPRKIDRLQTRTFGEIIMNENNYNSFFNHFETSYSVVEKKRLTEICDRLIEEVTRRSGGEFYTPIRWVDEAHKMIEEQFGLDWKEKYVVWDPAWGTGNLTRDYQFTELYCSTINHGDLSTARNYNPEATHFQYDFLNDDIMPEGILSIAPLKLNKYLLNALKEKKPIIILMNPPFAEDGNYKKDGVSKIGVSKSLISTTYKMGKAFKQKYIQFLFRCIMLKKQFNHNDISIATFSTITYLIGSNSVLFRDEFFKHFNFKDGMIFKASEFNGVALWPALFSIFKQELCLDKTNFNFKIKQNDSGTINYIGDINFYNTDESVSLKDWLNESNVSNDVGDNMGVLVNGPLSVIQNNIKEPNDSLGYFSNKANNIGSAIKHVGLYSSKFNDSGCFITETNFHKVVIIFSIRRILAKQSDWITDYKELLAPVNIPLEFYNDSIIYSLFETQSNLSSFRYDIKNIKNNFFWMSKDQIVSLANDNRFDLLYNDAIGDTDRFVFNKLQTVTLSDDAKVVLDKANELVIKSFQYRMLMNEKNPEWNLSNWDAGWYQIKKILNIYLKDDLKDFDVLYKKFEDRMREDVYKFGVLK